MGNALLVSDAVRVVSFTGSTAVGRILMQQSAPTLKKLSLELGGNAPFLVFDDADLDAAVEGALASKYRNAGQTCVCTNRFYAHAKIYDAFVERFAARAKKLVVGDPMNEATVIGPMISRAHWDKVTGYIDKMNKADGILLGSPVYFADITPQMKALIANQAASPAFAFNEALQSAVYQNHFRARPIRTKGSQCVGIAAWSREATKAPVNPA